MPRTDALPEPPGRRPAGLPALPREAVSLWRLHWEDDPLAPRRHRAGKYRFDAPAGEYPVTYGNRDRLACFAEVYGDLGLIPEAQGTRRLSLLSALRPLALAPLDDPAFRRRLDPRLDGRIATAKQYPVTQRWSLMLHTWFPEADGIRYTSRHAERDHNYCLFLDRCGADLQVSLQGELRDLCQIVLFAADRYVLQARVQWRR